MTDQFSGLHQANYTMRNQVAELQQSLSQAQSQKDQSQKADLRVGIQDYELQSRQQIEMIGNVFYNMLTLVGQRDRDPRFVDLGNSVKTMLQTRQFDDLMGPKVPMVKDGVVNLLKVVDLS